MRSAADLCGVTKETLSALERGAREPHDPTLAKIAKGYGVPFEELIEEPVPLGEAPRVGPAPGLLGKYDPETWKTRLNYHRRVLENDLDAWEEAVADLVRRGAPFHRNWSRTVGLAAADLWSWLEEDGILDDAEAFVGAIETGEEIPETVRVEVLGLLNAMVRLDDVTQKAMKAERQATTTAQNAPDQLAPMREAHSRKKFRRDFHSSVALLSGNAGNRGAS